MEQQKQTKQKKFSPATCPKISADTATISQIEKIVGNNNVKTVE